MITELLKNEGCSIKSAALYLKQGEILALPTETVYGLAGNAFSSSVVNKIFIAKERPAFDPLIVHVGSKLLAKGNHPIESLVNSKILSSEILNWPSQDLINDAMKKFWPGPLTLVLPRGPKIPNEVTSGQNTVGIRCPAHPLFQAVLDELDFPLAAPSANRFGRISPTKASHVLQELNGKIAAVLDGGDCKVGLESSIFRIENPLKISLLRPGQISKEILESHFGVPVELGAAAGTINQAQLAPGMLDQHYAPKKTMILCPFPFSQDQSTFTFLDSLSLQGTVFFIGMSEIPKTFPKNIQTKSIILSEKKSLEEMGQKLFNSLRVADQDPDIDFIVVDVPEYHNSGTGAAIRDRLNRASTNKPL